MRFVNGPRQLCRVPSSPPLASLPAILISFLLPPQGAHRFYRLFSSFCSLPCCPLWKEASTVFGSGFEVMLRGREGKEEGAEGEVIGTSFPPQRAPS